MNIQQSIQRYAQLKASANAGVQLSPAQQREARQIYERAQATLTPREAQQALRAADAMSAEIGRRYQFKTAQHDIKRQMYKADQVSRAATGMDVAQMGMALKTGKVPVRGGRSFTKKSVEKKIQGYLAPWGYGNMSLKAFEKISDRTAELQRDNPAKVNSYLISQFGNHAGHVKNLIDGYAMSGVSEEMALRGDQAEDELRDVNDDTMRRANLMDSFAKVATEDKGTARSLMEADEISDEYMESEFITGDISRAFDSHEKAEEAEEIENYEPDYYEVADGDETNGSF